MRKHAIGTPQLFRRSDRDEFIPSEIHVAFYAFKQGVPCAHHCRAVAEDLHHVWKIAKCTYSSREHLRRFFTDGFVGRRFDKGHRAVRSNGCEVQRTIAKLRIHAMQERANRVAALNLPVRPGRHTRCPKDTSSACELATSSRSRNEVIAKAPRVRRAACSRAFSDLLDSGFTGARACLSVALERSPSATRTENCQAVRGGQSNRAGRSITNSPALFFMQQSSYFVTGMLESRQRRLGRMARHRTGQKQ